MANKNFVVQNGITVGEVTIFAGNSDIRTSGNITVTGSGTINVPSIGVSSIAINDSSIAINDTGPSGSTIEFTLDNAIAANVSAAGMNLPTGAAFRINQTDVLSATTLKSGVINSSLTSVGTLQNLTVSGNTAINNTLYGRGIYDNSNRVLTEASTTSVLTSVGTLTALTVSGNTAINNTLYAQGLYDNSNRVLTSQSTSSILTSVGTLTALTVSGNTIVNNTLYGRGVYDNSNRVVSTSSGAGNLTISGTAITLPSTGPGAASVGSSTAIPVITTDAYGRVASTSTAAVVAPAGTLSGSVLASGVTEASLTTIGTLTALTVSGVTKPNANATVNLGATNAYWNSLYAVASNFNQSTIGGQGLSSAGIVTITNNSDSTGSSSGALQVTGGVGIGANLYVSGVSILRGNVTIGGNLTVSGQSVSIGTSDLAIQDPIINLHTFANLAPLTSNDGSDIGLKFHYYDNADRAAFLGRAADTGYLEWYAQGTDAGNVFSGTYYGTVKGGAGIFSNTTTSTSTTTGALQVGGGVGIAGNVVSGGIGYFGSASSVALTNPLLVATGNQNSFVQVQLQNTNAGGSASGDVVITADTGTDSANFIDIGINSSGYNDGAFTVQKALDGYAYVNGGNLTIGTQSANKNIVFHTGGTLAAQARAMISDIAFTVNATTTSTSTTTGALIVGGGAGIAGAVYAGSIQNTPIGSTTASTGAFTTLTTSGNTAINNTLYAQGVYDNSNRVVSTSSGTGNLSISAGAITLASTGPGAASVGSSTAIPVITTDAYGRVASTSTAAVVAPAGTLSGSTLNSGVTASSLTSVGTLTGLTVSGAVVPNGNVTVNLGGTSAYWNNTYAATGNYNQINIGAQGIIPTSNVVANLGDATHWFNTFYGKATQAQYADLAENYQADAIYEPGTVLMFGGENEVTVADADTTAVAGVVSTNPAHLMNGALQGAKVAPIALQGRVPCKVIGPIAKGDILVSAGFGFAKTAPDRQLGMKFGQAIGKALENVDPGTKATIEVVVGRV